MKTRTLPLAGAALLCALAFSTDVIAQHGAPATAETDTASTVAEFMVVYGDTLWMVAPLEVLGSRVPAALPGVIRRVEVVGRDEVETSPARSTVELLQEVPGVRVSQRQHYGVQADLSVRGSTFEQVQVLLDGFDVSDPQTGHHLANLPLGTQDIQRLEVLPGHGTALYGSGAFGGTINVVSRPPSGANGGEVAGMVGGNGIWGVRANGDLALGDGGSGLRIAAERFHTDGHDVRQADGSVAWGGNDADLKILNGRLRLQHDGAETDLFVGASDREFGALDFYAPTPSWERTRTLLTQLRHNRRLSDRWTIEPRLFVRRHTDLFILLRDDPDRYTNDHLTRRIGGEVRAIADLGRRHALALSLEGVYEDIDSQGVREGEPATALGEHLRRRASAAVEIDGVAGDLSWQLGGRVDTRSNDAPRPSVTAAASHSLGAVLTARASIGTVYRIPTFTELYYDDGVANRGDPGLSPEQGWTWDAGLDAWSGPWSGHLSYFQRHEEDLIEWARAAGDPIWQVMNVADGRVEGVDTRVVWRHGRGHTLSAGWSWLEKKTTLPAGFEGKYTLLAPRHQLILRGRAALPWSLGATVTGRYQSHTGGPADFREFFVLDGRVDWNHPLGWFAALTGTNLLERRYEEVPGVEMPGFVLTATVGRRF